MFEPAELIEKLVALVPAPRGHLVRYHGVLAAHARWRALVVRDREQPPQLPHTDWQTPEPAIAPRAGSAVETGELREHRLSWADLMRRVFARDVLECPGCGSRRQLIAVITQPDVIVAFLASLGLPTRAPPPAPARHDDPVEPSLF